MIHALNLTDNLLLSTAMTNSATQTANLDCLGADWATIKLCITATTSGTNFTGPTISLLESHDTVVTNFVTVTANRTAETSPSRKLVKYERDLRAGKRYLRLSVTTATTTHDNIVISAIGTTYRLAAAPASTSGMVASTNDVVVLVT